MIPLAFYRNDDSREVWSLLLYVYREIDHHVILYLIDHVSSTCILPGCGVHGDQSPCKHTKGDSILPYCRHFGKTQAVSYHIRGVYKLRIRGQSDIRYLLDYLNGTRSGCMNTCRLIWEHYWVVFVLVSSELHS
jgi:hypothetical protein